MNLLRFIWLWIQIVIAWTIIILACVVLSHVHVVYR